MPTRPRSSWLTLGLGVALLGASVSALPAFAAEAPTSVSVELAPVGPDGLGGLALLAPIEGGSSVQLLVVGAPAGTTAVVHAGDCAAIDPAPVGLLGDLGDGQLQAELPLALETLADGGHVIVLHPGLDLALALGCGAIPAVDLVAPPPDSVAPLPAPSAAVVTGGAGASAAPTSAVPEPGCEGVAAWAEASAARLDTLEDLADEADRLATLFDLPGYVAAIETYARAAEASAADQLSHPVPEIAQEANARALAAYATMVDAASLFLRYYTTEMTPDVFARAVSTHDQARRMVDELRRDTGRLTAMCESP
jgi:hypothetical protein